MKSINNMNTLNALIKDELMASKEYRDLAMGKNVPASMKKALLQMSKDEHSHMMNLAKYKDWLRMKKVTN